MTVGLLPGGLINRVVILRVAIDLESVCIAYISTLMWQKSQTIQKSTCAKDT